MKDPCRYHTGPRALRHPQKTRQTEKNNLAETPAQGLETHPQPVIDHCKSPCDRTLTDNSLPRRPGRPPRPQRRDRRHRWRFLSSKGGRAATEGALSQASAAVLPCTAFFQRTKAVNWLTNPSRRPGSIAAEPRQSQNPIFRATTSRRDARRFHGAHRAAPGGMPIVPPSAPGSLRRHSARSDGRHSSYTST